MPPSHGRSLASFFQQPVVKDTPKRARADAPSKDLAKDIISPPLKKQAVKEDAAASTTLREAPLIKKQAVKKETTPAKPSIFEKTKKETPAADQPKLKSEKSEIQKDKVMTDVKAEAAGPSAAGPFAKTNGEKSKKEPFTAELVIVGNRVSVKYQGEWKKGTIVKPVRANVSENYKIKAVKIHIDGTPFQSKQFKVPNKEILVLDEPPKTVDMNNNSFKILDDSNVWVRPAHHLTKDFKVCTHDDFSGQKDTKRNLIKADNAAFKILEELGEDGVPTEAHVLHVLRQIGEVWPTQSRPNVSSTGKVVPGICLGAVGVLGKAKGEGMQVSMISKCFRNFCKLITKWVRGTVPDSDYPFSSLQINYNYRAKRHVDGNNIGPSYIQSIGDHDGGALWIADKYMVEGGSALDTPVSTKGCIIKAGGGEGTLNCHRKWALFNGNAEHETQPFRPCKGQTKATRISFIAFSNQQYNKLLPSVAAELHALGFTAGTSDGEDLDFFKRYRIDKKEFGADENDKFFDAQAERAANHPPPGGRGVAAIECYGLTMARGGGWFSYRADADDGKDVPTVVELKPNMTGFHVLELKLAQKPEAKQNSIMSMFAKKAPKKEKGAASAGTGQPHRQCLVLASKHTDKARFNLYKDTVKECNRFASWVKKLEAGRIVLVCITDTAMAASRPLPPLLYDTLKLLGADPHMEPIGYRHPFALIGVKGMAPGEAVMAHDKTKVLLRLEAEAYEDGEGKVKLRGKKAEKVNVTDIILASERCKGKGNSTK